MADLATRAASGTVRDLFHRAFRIFADRIAVTSEDGALTYRELGDRSRRLASALHELGVRRGDRVAVLSETRPEYVETYAALATLGACVLTLNTRLRAEDIDYCLSSGKPKALLCSGSLSHLLPAAGDPESTVPQRICFDGADSEFIAYAELLDSARKPAPEIDVLGSDPHNVLYTSGTTGRPKGAVISQSAAAIRGLRLAQWFGLTPADGFVGWLPLFHCAGDESLYATMLTGGTYATLRKADVDTMFRMIERDRLSWTLLLPGVITDFLHHRHRDRYDLSSLRFAVGYANMMPHVVQQLTEACDIEYYDAFGQTETSYLLAHGVCRPGQPPTLRKTPSPLLDVRLVDDELREVGVGEPGECLVRGPSVMSGYLDDPTATDEVFRGGWLHTGDVLRRHEDGTMSFVDRKKYLIKTGGENVYPAEVEQVIAGHAAVQEVCVFGVPDAHWGETVKAVVVARPGQPVTATEIGTWCRERLAGFKRPHYVQFMTANELPRSTTGKLLRHELAKIPVQRSEAL